MFRFFLLVSGWASGGLAAAGYTLPAVYSATGEVRSQVARLDKLGADQSYSLLFSVNSPEALTADARVAVSVVETPGCFCKKLCTRVTPTSMYRFAQPAPAAANSGSPHKAQLAATCCRSIDGPTRPF